jgi:hypothetical protein
MATAIDVSNHQPQDLTELIKTFNPDFVIVKMYLPEEWPPQSWSFNQAASAKANGKKVWGYFWGYLDLDPRKSAVDAIQLLKACGGEQLIIDVEPYVSAYPPYDVSMPSQNWLRAAVDTCITHGITPWIYTGKWCWNLGTEFAYLKLHNAQYDHEPFRPYGGWQVESMRQWTSTPVDQNYLVEHVVHPPEENPVDKEKLIKALNNTWDVREALRQAAILFPALDAHQQKLFDAIVDIKVATGLQ